MCCLLVSITSRDTADVRKTYCAAFGPEFDCLSGSMDELKKLNRRYRVTFGYGKKDADGDYVVSHSSAMYIFDETAKARLLVKGTESIAELSDDLQQLLEMSHR